MTDVCGVLSVAKKAVSLPSSLLLFVISSIKTLEALLDNDQRALLYDIWNDTL